MSYLDAALGSFWQLTRHCQQDENEKLEMSCESGSLNIQLNAKLGHPDLLPFHHASAPPCKWKSSSQLRRQERRRHAAKTNVEEAKSTQNLSAEDIAPSKEAEKPKESFLEHENPQYSSYISPMINTEKPSQLFKFYHCDFVNVDSSVRHHMSITHKSFSCEYCNFYKMFSDIMKTHIQRKPHNVPSTHIIYYPFKYPLQKKNFDCAHPQYDPKFTKCLLRGEGCIHTANKYFLSVKVVINHQAQDHKEPA